MGSVPDGTLCAYCGINPAGYIPDGCVGPVCFDAADGSQSCFDAGYVIMINRRCVRFADSRFKVLRTSLGQNHPLSDDAIASLVASFLIHV